MPIITNILVNNYHIENNLNHSNRNYELYSSLNINDSLFISKWNTSIWDYDSSNSSQVKLPLLSNGIYNFSIDWGDGTNSSIKTFNQSEVLHTYPFPGLYELKIAGLLNGWSFEGHGDRFKIIEISHWGHLILGNSSYFFMGCSNLQITANDTPDLSSTSSLAYAFAYCYSFNGNSCSFNGNFSAWDTSHITNMSSMFESAPFNQSIGTWNVSRVTDFSSMFEEDTLFDQDISSWNVSQAKNMHGMFFLSSAFNSPIGNWDVSHVTDMSYMFYLSHFNQPLNDWNVSQVTNMAYMFSDTRFNQPLDKWNVAQVIDMFCMFGFSFFNQPLEDWNVSKVLDMTDMFDSSFFNQPIGTWNVSNVLKMDNMFKYDTLSKANYNNLLLGWSSLPLQHNVHFSAGKSVYGNSSVDARNYIIATFNWTISDGGFRADFIFNNSYTSPEPPTSIVILPSNSSSVILTASSNRFLPNSGNIINYAIILFVIFILGVMYIGLSLLTRKSDINNEKRDKLDNLGNDLAIGKSTKSFKKHKSKVINNQISDSTFEKLKEIINESKKS